MVNTETTDFEPVETMDLAGGDVCLDFANTASGRSVGPLREKLRAYADLVTWAERVGLVGERTGRRLRKEGARAPGEASAVLERARELREAIYRLFAAPEARADDLDLLSREAGRGAAERRVVAAGDGYRYVWPDSDSLDQMLWPAALSAGDLLTSPDREQVKECASHDCNWLFLDMSRNHSRRWCDMKVCGNRAKARRFAERHRDE